MGAGLTDPAVAHALEQEFALSSDRILAMIEAAPRLKMAVRGWVAEEHLYQQLLLVPGVTRCRRVEEDGRPDIELHFQGSGPLTIECKNVGPEPYKSGDRAGLPRLELQRTRAPKNNACGRYYVRNEFHVVAACLHPVRGSWQFATRTTVGLAEHADCLGRLHHLIAIDECWSSSFSETLAEARGAFL